LAHFVGGKRGGAAGYRLPSGNHWSKVLGQAEEIHAGSHAALSAEGVNVGGSGSTVSAICLLVRVVVPSRSIEAVTEASPVISGGSL